jgi:hypothetical protein
VDDAKNVRKFDSSTIPSWSNFDNSYRLVYMNEKDRKKEYKKLEAAYVEATAANELRNIRFEVCMICHGGGELIVCEKCEMGCHFACSGLKAYPKEEEDWFCAKCSHKSVGTLRSHKTPGRPSPQKFVEAIVEEPKEIYVVEKKRTISNVEAPVVPPAKKTTVVKEKAPVKPKNEIPKKTTTVPKASVSKTWYDFTPEINGNLSEALPDAEGVDGLVDEISGLIKAKYLNLYESLKVLKQKNESLDVAYQELKNKLDLVEEEKTQAVMICDNMKSLFRDQKKEKEELFKKVRELEAKLKMPGGTERDGETNVKARKK